MVKTERSTVEMGAWLTLLRAPQLSGIAIRRLVLRAGGAAQALQQLEALRQEVAISAEALAWLRSPDASLIDADLLWLEQPQHHLLTWTDIDFPDLLREIGAAPAALFVVGDPALLWQPQVAIVGARSATAGGLANARSFARSLSQAGFAITSGLADGIDGAAHTATLDAQGRTIAVMGTGADLVYPRKHQALAARIAADGALVSEFPLGSTARADSFPRRNRIISGLSLGTLVIEAGLRSGSLITARLAAEQGREVFALPGSIHNPLARGCHQLIRQGARLIEASDELIAELTALAQALGDRLRHHLADAEARPQASAGVPPRVAPRDADYLKVLAALGRDPVGLDELAQRSALSIASLSSMLLVLELEGEVASAGGGRYSRC